MCYDRDDIDWLHLYENVLNNPCFSLELNHHHPAHLWGYFHHHHHHHRHPRHHHHHYYYFMYRLHRTPDNVAQCAGLILVIASFFLFKMVTTRLVL